MQRWFVIALTLAVLAGCTSPAERLRQNPNALAGVDAATRAKISRGEIAVGFTPEMVRIALGKPLDIVHRGTDEQWLYRDHPRNPNDYISGGFRHRVEYDPVNRVNVTTVEPVDARLFPSLRTHTIRVTFRDGRVAAINSSEDP